MLTRLIIRNYAIIPELDLQLLPGLSAITGETGAGKSILLGALGLALGRRADFRILPDEESKCIVEAHFELQDNSLKELFLRESLDFDHQMICRREISSGGKSRSFVNDTPVSLKVLQELTGHLIELHQQHDNLALQTKEYQVNVLDTLSGALTLSKNYRLTYSHLVQLKNDLSKTKEIELSSARRKDFLKFQIEELENAKLTPGEIDKLEQEQNVLKHAESIDHTLELIQKILNDGPHALNNQLTTLIKQIESVRHVSHPLALIGDRIQALRLEVQDITLEAGRMDGIVQNDPFHLGRIESRLNQLYTLIKKYQNKDENGLINQYASLKKELNELSSVGDLIEKLEKNIAQTTIAIQKEAEQLSQKRKKGAEKIIPQMVSLIHELGMPNGQFSIELNPLQSPGPDGMDDIQFLFSANKGMSLQPIQSVASGGELSRLSLALKSLYAAQAKLPTIIFDEIDTGISGEVAWRMGQLIRSLSKGHQVLMITHSPQIAVHAKVQYHVSKIGTGARDKSSVMLLTPADRLVEIAKMLSGDQPSKEALANAKSLMNAVKN
ncbi:MAG: DNA repair protein RecN [Saprospiraceae bacterium]|uniref:DNA repair protein RecN n=1 Tax=Candidatus Opimibacter skivensis TaxID=2982028 RepID=A0A9D7SWC7_9BACT|nr:DNA repair protein RecN [Candidatus Opimibacter skivensis]